MSDAAVPGFGDLAGAIRIYATAGSDAIPVKIVDLGGFECGMMANGEWHERVINPKGWGYPMSDDRVHKDVWL